MFRGDISEKRKLKVGFRGRFSLYLLKKTKEVKRHIIPILNMN